MGEVIIKTSIKLDYWPAHKMKWSIIHISGKIHKTVQKINVLIIYCYKTTHSPGKYKMRGG